MRQIASLSIARLHVEEDFGFMKLVVAETGSLPKGGEEDRPENLKLSTSVAAFKGAFDAFDKALKDASTVPAAAVAAEADASRSSAWRGARNYLKAMAAHPSEEISEAAIQLGILFDKYGDPTSLSQTEESGILHNLLQDLKAFDGGKIASIYFEPWLTRLETCENAFLAAVAQRTEEESARQVGIVKEARQAADNAYRSLVGLLNALVVVNGDEAYATFIDHVNAIIGRQDTVLKTRQTVNKKKEK